MPDLGGTCQHFVESCAVLVARQVQKAGSLKICPAAKWFSSLAIFLCIAKSSTSTLPGQSNIIEDVVQTCEKDQWPFQVSKLEVPTMYIHI